MFTAKTVYAQVAFERAIDKVFDYIVPSELVDKLVPGSIVRAPFGDKVLDGIVAALVDTPSVDNLKKIDAVSEETILHETKLFELAQWISAYYLCPLGLTLKAMYPSYVRRKKTEQETVYVSLTMNREDTVRMIDRLSQSARRQADVLSWLLTAREPMIDKQRVIKNAHADMRVLQGLEKKGAISLISETQITCQENNSSRYKFVDSISSVQLSPSQSAVMEKICSALSEPTFTPFVLHGVTGSGKTEVYIRAIQEVLKNGREAIMLIPEISLTPQTEESFRKRFGDQVAVFHSRLSDGQRAGEWKKMRDGAVKLVVGARSALFAPFKNLGIIIVDEEHERSYKQGETPRYNARDVAIVRAKMEGIPVILGSATPSLETIENVKKGKYTLLELPVRIDNRPMPEIHLVDLAKETREEKKVVVFSFLLQQKIQERLERGEQIILFLNRRGFSSMALCADCGFIFECSDCTVSYTYHKSIEKLMCHMCGKRMDRPKYCLKCSGGNLKFSGIGTQKVERMLHGIFPEARIIRMDSDTTTHKNAHEELLGEFRRGKADILIGTQMIAKGLDFPRVTLVGVILAESSLKLPDFRAAEVTFQLLTQVAGRAGRGVIAGEVVVQSFMHTHPAVVCAIKQDYHMFLDGETRLRAQLSYPPFSHFILVVLSGTDKKKTQWVGTQLAQRIQRSLPPLSDIRGPMPSLIEKRNKRFYWNIILRTSSVFAMNDCIRQALKKCDRLSGVKISIDVDPYSMW